MNAELFSAAILLLLVVDPFGNIPLVVSALQNVAPQRRMFVVVRECAAAFVLLAVFMVGGQEFLRLMRLSSVSLSIAGGIILFLIAIRMVFHHRDGVFGEVPGGEPMIVPVAIPLIAGPSALATVMLMASRDPQHMATWFAALSLAMTVNTVVLMASEKLHQVLGDRALVAFERLMGLVLTALAVEMLLSGVRGFVESLAR